MSDDLKRLRILTDKIEFEPSTEAKIERILGICIPGKALINEKTQFVFSNPYFCEMVGYDWEELQKIQLGSLIPAHHADQHAANVNDWFKSPRIIVLRRVELLRKAGDTILVNVGIAPQDSYAAIGMVKYD